LNLIQLTQQSWNQHWLKLKQERWLAEGCAAQKKGTGRDAGVKSGDWLSLSFVPLQSVAEKIDPIASPNRTGGSALPDFFNPVLGEVPMPDPESGVLWAEQQRLSDRQAELSRERERIDQNIQSAQRGMQETLAHLEEITTQLREEFGLESDRQSEARSARLTFQDTSVVVNLSDNAFMGYDRQTEANDRSTEETVCDFLVDVQEGDTEAAQRLAEQIQSERPNRSEFVVIDELQSPRLRLPRHERNGTFQGMGVSRVSSLGEIQQYILGFVDRSSIFLDMPSTDSIDAAAIVAMLNNRGAFPVILETSLDRPIACANCRNYCGQSYGHDRLVCAMHPYGVEGESCEDWEGKG